MTAIYIDTLNRKYDGICETNLNYRDCLFTFLFSR